MFAWFTSMSAACLSWCARVGQEWDVFLNVLFFDGLEGETISRHAALAEVTHARWGCVLCRWLSLTVETDHCARTLVGEAEKTGVFFRAGLQLFAVFVVLVTIANVVWKWIS